MGTTATEVGYSFDLDFGPFDTDVELCSRSMFGSNQTVDVSFQHSPSHLLLFSDGEQFLSSAIDEFNIFDINSKEDVVEGQAFGWSEDDDVYPSIDILSFASPRGEDDDDSSPVPSPMKTGTSKPRRARRRRRTSTDVQLDALTDVISHDLDLRDQLELLRIVRPHADLSPSDLSPSNLSPTDAEFVIDLSSLSTEQLKQVEELVRRRKRECEECGECGQADCHTSHQQQHKRTKKGVSRQQKSSRRHQQKEHRQVKKEQRSGLFEREEVLSLSVFSPDDGADVDILS